MMDAHRQPEQKSLGIGFRHALLYPDHQSQHNQPPMKQKSSLTTIDAKRRSRQKTPPQDRRISPMRDPDRSTILQDSGLWSERHSCAFSTKSPNSTIETNHSLPRKAGRLDQRFASKSASQIMTILRDHGRRYQLNLCRIKAQSSPSRIDAKCSLPKKSQRPCQRFARDRATGSQTILRDIDAQYRNGKCSIMTKTPRSTNATKRNDAPKPQRQDRRFSPTIASDFSTIIPCFGAHSSVGS